MDFLHGRKVRRPAATCALTTPTRPRKTTEFVDAIMEDITLARLIRGTSCAMATLRLLTTSATNWPSRLDPRAAWPMWTTCTKDEMREYRGTLTEPGKNSPLPRPQRRGKPRLCSRRMQHGRIRRTAATTLRAKIDMASPNINMRDPAHVPHLAHMRTIRRAIQWCIYPMYDFAHPDRGRHRGHHAIRCARWNMRTHRPLYNWVVEQSANSAHAARGRSSSRG